MDENEAEYFRSLDLQRKISYLQHKWGAFPVVAFDLFQDPKGRWTVLMSCAVVNPILAAELGEPEPAIVAKAVRNGYRLEDHFSELLLIWQRNVAQALER